MMNDETRVPVEKATRDEQPDEVERILSTLNEEAKMRVLDMVLQLLGEQMQENAQRNESIGLEVSA